MVAPPGTMPHKNLVSGRYRVVQAFFVDNTVGRAFWAFQSHPRAPWYYFANLWITMAPTSVFLVPAAWIAWRRRRDPLARPGLFFLTFAAGATAGLSVMRAKAPEYLLPVYPAFALLVAWGLLQALQSERRWARGALPCFEALPSLGFGSAQRAELLPSSSLDATGSRVRDRGPQHSLTMAKPASAASRSTAFMWSP